MNSEFPPPKFLFKLNHHLLKPKPSHPTPVRFTQKENSPFSNQNDPFKLLTKNTLKPFHLPKRFKKHNNKIENNMTVINKTTSEFASAAVTKTCSSSFYKSFNQPQNLSSTMSLLTKKMSKISMQEPPKQRISLQPRTRQGIEKLFDQKYSKMSDNVKQKMIKHYEPMLRLKPRKISKEISQIFSQNKHLYMLSRFTLLELKSYYCAILKFAKDDPSKFKYAFEVMLNLANITVRENIIAECLKDLIKGGINFTKFLQTFTLIQQKLRKQTIIDYFEILLEDVKQTSLTYDELTKTFEGRMKKQIASELSDLLYESLRRGFGDKILKRQIPSLCYENEMFCATFLALNNQNMLNNKFEPADKSGFLVD